jgi:hypothetical protein
MQSKWLGRIGLTALVMGVVGGSSGMVGCAAERDPIDRTQPGVVTKSFFIGANFEDYKDDPEFRTKSYNIDSGAQTSSYLAAIGGSSAVDRVRWEVTENWLFARRSYQESPGADNRGLPRKEVEPGKFEFPGKPNGTIIAAYKISKHFDVRRAYNAQTGEETNVIEENDSDRPWNQREYMRVDWSKNVAQSTSGDTNWVFGEGTSATAVEYSATNVTDEDRPVFDQEKGYFDITNKYQAKSEVNPGWGVSECVILGFLNGGSSFDCTPAEVKVRHSFVRLTGEEDFEPFEESFAPRDIVGNWGNAGNNFNREYGAPPITQWDPQYGYTDAQTKTFYSMHNIWEKSHQQVLCKANTDADKDGTADECSKDLTGYAGANGSQCDTVIGKCTLPVRDREVKTIGYWLNAEAPIDLQDEVAADGKTITRAGALEESTITWNQLMKVAVATRREVECRRTRDGSRDECHDRYFDGSGPDGKDMVAFGGWGISRTKELAVDKGKPVVTTCHNPVRAYDPASCGAVGERARLGDVRKNFATYWPYASRAPYGGVATIGADPLTGEMLGVTATTMMRSATAAAAQQRDIIQIALGDLKVEDLIQGAPASTYANLVKNGKVGESGGKTQAEINTLVANVQQARIQSELGQDPAKLAVMSKSARTLAAAKADMKSAPYTANSVAADRKLAALVKQLDNTEFKTDIGNRGLLKLVADSQNKSSEVYNALSTFAAKDPTKVQDLMDQYSSYLGNKGICFQDTAAAAAGSIYQPSLAPYFKRLYGSLDPKERGAKIYQDLLRESVKGIAFHEIGHSIGLRHNFASSWDSPNYSPQYWQLRTNEGKSTDLCNAARAGGADTCMGPRYLDPLTDDEQGLAGEPRPGIEYFANTSTMEYQIERFGETVGAGTYDLHAMKTLYGRTLETFDERLIKPEEQQYFAVKTLSQGIPDELIFNPEKGYGAHYTRGAVQAKVFDEKRDCRPATEAEKAAAKWRIVHGKVCAPSPKNNLAYEDMKSSEISFDIGGQVTSIGVNGVRWAGEDENGTKLVRWQFRYGEDYSRGGYIHAKLFDSGADVYEITQNVAKRFDLTYPWSYFRRQNREFAWWSLAAGAANNTFSRLRAYHWSTTTDISRASAADLADDDQTRPAVMAAAEMFNFLQRVVLMPEPGVYAVGPDTKRRTPTRPGALTIFDINTADGARAVANVGIIDGRFVQVDFDNDRGGSWDYQAYPVHTGFDEEKVLALRELIDSRPTLSTVSRENGLDGRDPYISFRTDTPHAVDRLLGGLLSEDWETIAPAAMGAEVTKLDGFSLINPDATKLVRPAGSSILFPNVGYSNQISAGIYALIFSRFSTDLTLATKLRIRLDGDNAPVLPEARKQAFTDPVSGHRYIATRFGTEKIQGRDVERGIGSRMLQRANELLAAAYQVKTDGGGAPIININGEPELVLVNGAPVAKVSPDAEKNLRRYVGLLDGMRQVGNLFGGGPLGGGGGGED